ncbi:uncharacterized protein OCT59_016773 [Rhizophagus irregularis]|uniref:uncharacterized protein n=1 Tax=Rhizophagus irregularis TaxID=588596 RepID=UPI00331FCE63|nr:hypothetical protein OCT59_016773 [Rhizophagus irregularis]
MSSYNTKPTLKVNNYGKSICYERLRTLEFRDLQELTTFARLSWRSPRKNRQDSTRMRFQKTFLHRQQY